MSVEEAMGVTVKNLDYCLNHGVDVIDFNHGKGFHSNRNFSVIKQEIRKLLKDYPLRDAGYKLIYGESDLPVALTFDEGHTLVVSRNKEMEYIGGRVQQERNHLIFSDEGKKKRKQDKKQRASKQPDRKKY
jgi:hypothetical protein